MPAIAKPRTAAEVGRVGDDLLKRVIEPTLSSAEDGRFIAVDIDSGEYVVDDDDRAATDRLRARVPAAEIWLARVREEAADRMGMRW